MLHSRSLLSESGFTAPRTIGHRWVPPRAGSTSEFGGGRDLLLTSVMSLDLRHRGSAESLRNRYVFASVTPNGLEQLPCAVIHVAGEVGPLNERSTVQFRICRMRAIGPNRGESISAFRNAEYRRRPRRLGPASRITYVSYSTAPAPPCARPRGTALTSTALPRLCCLRQRARCAVLTPIIVDAVDERYDAVLAHASVTVILAGGTRR